MNLTPGAHSPLRTSPGILWDPMISDGTINFFTGETWPKIVDHSPLATAEKSFASSTFAGSSCQGRTHFPTQIRSSCSQHGNRQGGDCLQTRQTVSRGKDARHRRETVRRSETTSACTRGKLSVYRLEVATEGLQPKLAQPVASCSSITHELDSHNTALRTFSLTTATVTSRLPSQAYI